jgi:allantoicase
LFFVLFIYLFNYLYILGEVKKDWSATPPGLVDLASTENGGLGLMASNAHYGAVQGVGCRV